jgi:uncharacterized membrane protein
MNRKWLNKEGKDWIKDGLLTQNQLDRILERYDSGSTKSLLPTFASILIGLGILTFIASNWDVLPNPIKLIIIVVFVSTFYIAGQRIHINGNERLGHSLIGLGIITFGSGLILIGQMFHLTPYNASTFVIWALGSISLLALYRSKFIYFLTTLIIIAGQIYSTVEFGTFNYLLALLILFGIGHFVYHRPSITYSVTFLISVIITGLLYVVNSNTSYLWLSILALGLLLISEIPNRKKYFKPFQTIALIFQVGLIGFSIFIFDNVLTFEPEIIPNPVSYLISLFVLLFIYVYIQFQLKSKQKLLYILLFIPVLFFGEFADVLFILSLYLFAILALVFGYQYQRSEYINNGTFVFLISTFIAYVHLAWDFMPKSLFFLSGGILLFALSWFLEKRRRKWLEANGGDPQ